MTGMNTATESPFMNGEQDSHLKNNVVTPHILPTSEVANAALGVGLEVTADVMTGCRAIGGIVMKKYIEVTPDYQSWATFGAFAILAISDGEGKIARFGRKLQGKDESIRRPFKSYFDLLADKVLVDSTMKAIANRELANGNIAYATAVEIAAEITITRDVITTGDRIIADLQHIDTRAQKSGKVKALRQYIVTALALSPLAERKPMKAILAGAFLYTAKDSVTSGISLHNYFAQARAAHKAVAKST